MLAEHRFFLRADSTLNIGPDAKSFMELRHIPGISELRNHSHESRDSKCWYCYLCASRRFVRLADSVQMRIGILTNVCRLNLVAALWALISGPALAHSSNFATRDPYRLLAVICYMTLITGDSNRLVEVLQKGLEIIGSGVSADHAPLSV